MPLPDTSRKVPWPPLELADVYEEIELHAALYSGDPAEIQFRYADTLERAHIPLAGDLASSSASLLFSEPPDFESEDEALLESIDELVEDISLHDTLLEAAELAAALGGVFLVPRWNLEYRDRAYVHAAQPDAVVPYFKAGVLAACIFWTEIERSNSNRVVVRHLESHDLDDDGRCVVTHAVYRGTPTELGQPRSLEAYAQTADLDETINTSIMNTLDCVYVPNLRPNRHFRTSSLGRSDFQGIEPVLRSLDLVYDAWMRDVDLGRAHITVPEEYVNRKRNKAATFDLDQRIFTALPVDPANRDSVVSMFQPAIRAEDFERTAMNLIERAVSANYSPQTFGLHIEGRAESGTALKLRERKTMMTQAKKQRLWGAAIEQLLENLLRIETSVLDNTDVTEGRARIKWAEITGEDISGLAGTISALATAQAISTQEKVRRINPQWNEDEVREEVARIQDENGLAVPSPEQVGEFS